MVTRENHTTINLLRMLNFLPNVRGSNWKIEMIKDQSLHTMQVSVPHSEYAPCEYFMPKELADWLDQYGLRGSYCGGSSWGNGYTDAGVTNRESTYMVHNIKPEDAIAFQIMFPKCRLHVTGPHYD
jgi:hypothetical protein